MRKQDINIYNTLVNNGILNIPDLNDVAIRYWGENFNNVSEHYDSFLLNRNLPNSSGPIEKHPYIELYDADCDFKRETLLLGTFPPSSYFNNLLLNNLPNPNVQNNIPTHFYYGNMNDLWFYLFGVQGIQITIPLIQSLLRDYGISITDVFSFVTRNKMSSAFDSEYRNIVLNHKISKVFTTESNIKTVLFTSGSLSTFLGNTTSTLTGFRWILEDCCGGLDNFLISGDISGEGQFFPVNPEGLQSAVNQQNGGIVWWIQFNLKKIRIVNLPSPAPMAAQQMMSSVYLRKWLNFKANINGIDQIGNETTVRQYVELFPQIFSNPITKQFRREVYQMVLNNEILNI